MDTFKQALEAKLQSLKPSGVTERNVVFSEVRPGAPGGGSYPFQATLVIRDYGPGYPANHFYGETCLRRMDKTRFTLARDSFGDWSVAGPMTPSLDKTTCQRNPAAGVSSLPLSSIGK